jgi:hypothetical protein
VSYHPSRQAHANRIRILQRLKQQGTDTHADRFELKQLLRLWYEDNGNGS